MNSELTNQQAKEEYMEYIYSMYGGKFKFFVLSGHSLGGNDAEHICITAPKGMLEQCGRCVNNDGSGFLNEYFEAHKENLERTSSIFRHYAWSSVGSLLFTTPRVEYTVIKANNLALYQKQASLYHTKWWSTKIFNFLDMIPKVGV